MLKIKNVSAKNFMSVGNNTQAVNFDGCQLTLVLGHNLDMGGDGSRNGTGKTTIIIALSYALYGDALTNIRKDNLINLECEAIVARNINQSYHITCNIDMICIIYDNVYVSIMYMI